MQDSRPTPAMVGTHSGHTSPDTDVPSTKSSQTLRERLSEGTEHLSEAARERVIAARHRAIDAQRSARNALHGGSDAAVDIFDRQPLVVGALAFAVGAAVAAMLPRTKTENSYMGSHRDSLMSEAERIFKEESDRAQAAIRTAQTEAQDAVKSVTDTAAKAAREAAEESAEAVKDAAAEVKSEAKSSAQQVKTETRDAAKK